MGKFSRNPEEYNLVGYCSVGYINGVLIQIHWSLFVVGIAVLFGSISLGWELLIVGVSLFLIIQVHETGHAVLVERYGGNVVGIKYSAIGGECIYVAPRSELEDAVIAWGGALGQATLFIPSFLYLYIFGKTNHDFVNVTLVVFAYLNPIVMVINLAPAKGLDGEKAWKVFRLMRNGN